MSDPLLFRILEVLLEMNEREKRRDAEYEAREKRMNKYIEETTKMIAEDLRKTNTAFESALKNSLDLPEGHPLKEILKLAKKRQDEIDRERENFKPVRRD